MEPKSTSSNHSGPVDDREYNAGRVIGMLERWLIYLVVILAQNYNVIALILAAKESPASASWKSVSLQSMF